MPGVVPQCLPHLVHFRSLHFLKLTLKKEVQIGCGTIIWNTQVGHWAIHFWQITHNQILNLATSWVSTLMNGTILNAVWFAGVLATWWQQPVNFLVETLICIFSPFVHRNRFPPKGFLLEFSQFLRCLGAYKIQLFSVCCCCCFQVHASFCLTTVIVAVYTFKTLSHLCKLTTFTPCWTFLLYWGQLWVCLHFKYCILAVYSSAFRQDNWSSLLRLCRALLIL